MQNKKGFTLQNFSKKNLGGFTLIELLIVIAIITILAAAAIVGINPAERFKAARNATRWSHMNAIATGIYSYAVNNDGMLPDCVPDYTVPAATASVGICDELVPNYMSATPTPPLADDTPAEQYVVEETAEGLLKITSNKAEAIDEGVEVIQ